MELSILGSGLMGKDIAIFLSQSEQIKKINLHVIGSDFNKKKKEFSAFKDSQSTKLKSKHNTGNYKKISLTKNIAAVSKSDFIIEAATEDFLKKATLIESINSLIDPSCIFFSNTSSLSIEKLSKYYLKENNFFGMHFFNPVNNTRLVELIYLKKSQKKILKPFKDLLEELNKKVIMLTDHPGFIVNRLLLVQIIEACEIYSEGIASFESIDNAFKLATNSFKGPFEISDLIGNDIVLQMLKNIYQDTNALKYKPHSVLELMVKKNFLGKKTNKGFYKY